MPELETNELILGLGEDVVGLRAAVHALAGAMRRSRVTTILLAAALGVTLLLGVSVGYVAIRASASVSCIHNWGNATSHRTVVLTTLNNSRLDALDLLLRDLLTTTPSQAKILIDSKAYLKVSDDYRQAAKLNPTPTLPSFQCRVF